MVKEHLHGQMGTYMWGDGKMRQDMGKGHTFILMGINSQENGNQGKNMGKDHLPGLMETNLLGNTKLVSLGTDL